MTSKRRTDTREHESAGCISAGSDKPVKKRPKASQACATCRKHKTRCELLDTTFGKQIQCHRCKVLHLECSFQHSDIIILPPKSTAAQQELGADSVLLSNDGAAISVSPGTDCGESGESPSPASTCSNGSTPSYGSLMGSRAFKAEDLLPTPHTPWGYLNLPDGLDWSTSPILAILELTRPSLYHQPTILPPDASLHTVLTQGQISYLLDVFETRYRPWLNTPSGRETGNTPILDLSRCMIASRHLDAATRAKVSPQLQALVEVTILGQLSPSYASSEFAEALLVLTLWAPLCGGAYAIPRNGRLLASAAIDHGIKLGLDQALFELTQIQTRNKLSTHCTTTPEYIKAYGNLRLWLALTNTESLTKLGTGPINEPLRLDALQVMSVLPKIYAAEHSRDWRLGLLTKLFAVTETGVRLTVSSISELDEFYRQATEVLNRLQWIHRQIMPLPVISQLESFYFNMIEVTYHACRLMVLHTILREMRLVFDKHTRQHPEVQFEPWFQARHNGLYIAHWWASDALYTAEAALVSFLSRSDLPTLSTMPDNYFVVITFAAAFLIVIKFAIFHIKARFIAKNGHAEDLLTMTIERFTQAALTQDHVPARCAEVIRDLLDVWERKGPRAIEGSEGECVPIGGTSHYQLGQSTRGASCAQPDAGCQATLDINMHYEGCNENNKWTAGVTTDSQPPPLSGSMPPTFGDWSSSDMFLDPQFWSSFIDNLNT